MEVATSGNQPFTVFFDSKIGLTMNKVSCIYYPLLNYFSTCP